MSIWALCAATASRLRIGTAYELIWMSLWSFHGTWVTSEGDDLAAGHDDLDLDGTVAGVHGIADEGLRLRGGRIARGAGCRIGCRAGVCARLR